MSNSTVQLTALINGFAALKTHWRQDSLAGFLVFLIALPLCLGVAVASGFPPMAGILSAVVGGLLVSRINGSHVTITGPAAGLIVVILTAVQTLGQGDDFAGYRYTLAAITISGGLQILLGFFKAGRLSAFFPASVVHGMLAAIGIIIMAKQIPVMVGVRTDAHTMLASLSQLPHALTYFIPQVAMVALIGLIILIGWPQLRHPLLKMIPAPIVVIISGMLLGKLLNLSQLDPSQEFIIPKDLILGPHFLVSIPDSLLVSIVFPDFSKLFTLAFWESVVAITLIGSLESLLSTAAVDKLDPQLRNSDLNRDLSAVGIGNLVAGLIGGMPMITEIVRSSANVDAGAQTSWANFFHGLFLLIFVMALPHVIDAIPLASLAALLVYTGFRLTSPRTFTDMLDIGKEQLALFVVTIISILATNLLAGVVMGILAKLLLHLMRGVPLKNVLRLSYRVKRQDADTYLIRVRGSAIFSNILALKSHLALLPVGKTIFFDLSEVFLIDHTVMELIDHYRDDYIEQGGRCEIRGLEEHEAYADHELAARINKPQDE